MYEWQTNWGIIFCVLSRSLGFIVITYVFLMSLRHTKLQNTKSFIFLFYCNFLLATGFGRKKKAFVQKGICEVQKKICYKINFFGNVNWSRKEDLKG